MTSVFKHFVTRAMGLCTLLVMGFVQTGCAHEVFVEPSVVVHSRMGHMPSHFPGHFSVQAQVGIPGAVVFASPPQVIYVPAPPPARVLYLPPGMAPVHAGGHGHGHDRHRRVQERRNPWGAGYERGGYRAHEGRSGGDGRGHRDGRYR
jgi:hypothetical protein